MDWLTDPAKLAAIATVVIALFTGTLFFATRGQLKILRRSVRISEDALTVLERPYVYVNQIEIAVLGSSPSAPSMVAVTFKNHGRTPANIAEAEIHLRVLDHLPTAADAEMPGGRDANGSDIEIIIGQGETWRAPWVKCPDAITIAVHEAIEAQGRHFYCWGAVKYRDIFRRSHPTVFCRRLKWKSREWEPIGGMDRNYGE